MNKLTSVRLPLKANPGLEIPQLGLGVYQTQPGQSTRQAVRWALEAGYRQIDTASVYQNEADVGQAIRDSGLPRESIFVTTKLWNDDQGYESTLKAFEQSRQALGLEYIDLYLIHFPVPGKRRESWRALEKLQQAGNCRAIGVSNYSHRHLYEMESYANQAAAVNQVEFSPYLYQQRLLKYCQVLGIQLAAYSPLTRGEMLNDPPLLALAQKYARSTAQLLIRWAIQHQLVVLPKSVHQQRIQQNAAVFDFEISASDMQALNQLNQDRHFCWDPSDVE